MNSIGVSPFYFIHGETSEDCCIPPFLQKNSQLHLRVDFIFSEDSYSPTAFQIVTKIQSYFFENSVLPSSLSKARGKNPFPWDWRTECLAINQLHFLDYLNSSNPEIVSKQTL